MQVNSHTDGVNTYYKSSKCSRNVQKKERMSPFMLLINGLQWTSLLKKWKTPAGRANLFLSQPWDAEAEWVWVINMRACVYSVSVLSICSVEWSNEGSPAWDLDSNRYSVSCDTKCATDVHCKVGARQEQLQGPIRQILRPSYSVGINPHSLNRTRVSHTPHPTPCWLCLPMARVPDSKVCTYSSRSSLLSVFPSACAMT